MQHSFKDFKDIKFGPLSYAFESIFLFHTPVILLNMYKLCSSYKVE